MDPDAVKRFARHYREQPRPEAEPAPGPAFDNRGIALVLALLTLSLLLVTAPRIGVTWDEPAYIAASESYVAWLGRLVTDPGAALSGEGIRYGWELNHEHPPLGKVWSGLVWVVARTVFDDLMAHRLGNMILVSGLIGMLYLLVASGYGRIAGIAASAALLTMPRFFFHAHLAALDVPSAVTIVAITLLFWHTHERHGWFYGVLLGLIWGLALATKINAIFVLPTLGLWTLIFRRRLYLIGRLMVMSLAGLPLALVLWPWLYHESWARLVEYLRFVTVDHHQIGQWYLGAYYLPPPWHFPFVMAFAVIPSTLTLLYGAGIVRTVFRSHGSPLGWLLIMSGLVPLLALTTGKSVVYDNERLFMPAFPFLAALAGVGFAGLLRGLSALASRAGRPLPARGQALGMALIFFLPQTVGAGLLYPHLLSYYSANVGGLQRATRLGLENTYWCETYAEALPYLNQKAEPGAIVWVEDWSYDVMLYYQRLGWLRPDLRITAPAGAVSVFGRTGAQPFAADVEAADFAVLQYRQTGFVTNPSIGRLRSGSRPVHQLSHRGVPLMEVYEQ